MAQAKIKKVRSLRRYGLPKDDIALAVRYGWNPLNQEEAAPIAGSSFYQAATGQRILAERHRIRSIVVAGDLKCPLGNVSVYSHAFDSVYNNYFDGTHILNEEYLSFNDDIYYVWLQTEFDEIVDFAAWEAPARAHRKGMTWTGPNDQYLWSKARGLMNAGYRIEPDETVTGEVAKILSQSHIVDIIDNLTRTSIDYLDKLPAT